jgi:hypothetical protein
MVPRCAASKTMHSECHGQRVHRRTLDNQWLQQLNQHRRSNGHFRHSRHRDKWQADYVDMIRLYCNSRSCRDFEPPGKAQRGCRYKAALAGTAPIERNSDLQFILIPGSGPTWLPAGPQHDQGDTCDQCMAVRRVRTFGWHAMTALADAYN